MGKKKKKKEMRVSLSSPVLAEPVLKVSPGESLSARIYFGVCFLFHLALYFMTLCPTVYAGDAGQFISIVHTMGIAHPPGHPTYLLIGKLFDLIPFGGPAFGLNFMSAFFGAASTAITFLVIRRLVFDSSRRDIIAFVSAIFFGTSRSFWEYSSFAETYTLNMFFVSLLVLLLLRIKEDRTDKVYSTVAVFGLLTGLGLGNHPTLMFWIPSFAAVMLLCRRDLVFSLRAVRNVLVSGLAGFSIYFYVYFRGMANPQFDIPRITSFQKFLYTLMARQYGNVPMAKVPLSFKGVVSGLADAATWGGSDFTAVVWIITLIAFIAAFRKYYKIILPLLIPTMMMFSAVVVNPAARFSLDRSSYGIGAFFVFAMCIGAGLAVFSEKLEQVKLSFTRYAASTITMIVILFAAVGQVKANYVYADKSGKYLAYDAGLAVLNTLEPGAVLFIQKDWISFSLAYLTAVEKMRPDVTIYNRTSTMFPNLPDLFTVKFRSIYEVMQRSNVLENEFIKSTDRPVYFDDRKSMANLPGYKMYNKGFLYKVSKEKEDTSVSPFDEYYIRNLYDPLDLKNMAECKIFIDYYVHLAEDRFQEGRTEEALSALKTAEFYARDTFSEKQNIMLVYVENRYYNEALVLLEEQAELLPGYAVTYKKMGLLYAQYIKNSEKAVYYLELYLEKDPYAFDRQSIVELIKKISK